VNIIDNKLNSLVTILLSEKVLKNHQRMSAGGGGWLNDRQIGPFAITLPNTSACTNAFSKFFMTRNTSPIYRKTVVLYQ